jgi:hypothetical protein
MRHTPFVLDVTGRYRARVDNHGGVVLLAYRTPSQVPTEVHVTVRRDGKILQPPWWLSSDVLARLELLVDRELERLREGEPLQTTALPPAKDRSPTAAA